MSELEILEERLFIHKMKDNWDNEDFKIAEELEKQIEELKKKLSEDNDRK